MIIRSAKELDVYRKAYELAMLIFHASRRFPVEERYALTGQIRRSSRSISMNLREAWAKRRYPAHFIAKLTDCDGENSETDTSLDYARACGYITPDEHKDLTARCREIGKMLGSMIRNPRPFLQTSKPSDLRPLTSAMNLPRRRFLRSAGVALALPCLDVFAPTRARGAAASAPRRRMVCICTPLGLYPPHFFPEKSGKDYELTPYLELLQDYRSDFTVISGLAHAGMSSSFGHQAGASFLTGVPGAGRPGFRNAISLDQFAADHIGSQTRFPSLALAGEGPGLSWTRTGALVPAATSPSRVFARLFLEGRADEVQAQVRRLEDGRSILDDVRDQAARLRTDLGTNDREKLDEYLTSVRELEQRLVKDEGWTKRPKPKVDVEPPKDIPNVADLIGRTRLLFDLTHLALQTDSTRLITIMLAGSTYVPPIEGVNLGHHDLSHHGKDPGKLAQLKIVEVETMKTLRDMLARLKQTNEDGASLLDQTTVFLGSNLGDGSSHSVKNLPVLLAGGGFKHGQHLAFDENNHPPLCNLFVSMLQRLGIEADKFGTSTSTLTGLEAAG